MTHVDNVSSRREAVGTARDGQVLLACDIETSAYIVFRIE